MRSWCGAAAQHRTHEYRPTTTAGERPAMFDDDEQDFIDPEECRAMSFEFGKPWAEDAPEDELEE